MSSKIPEPTRACGNYKFYWIFDSFRFGEALAKLAEQSSGYHKILGLILDCAGYISKFEQDTDPQIAANAAQLVCGVCVNICTCDGQVAPC